MPLVILPAHLSDIGPVFDVYFAAFNSDPVMDFLFPGGVDRIAHTEAMTRQWTRDKNSYPVKCIDTGTGDIVGMAVWEIFWHPCKTGWPRPEGVTWLEGKDREKAEGVIFPMWDMRKHLFGETRHVYLPMMAVHPDHQRRGAGRLLMQWGMDVAAKLELPIYLEATKPGYTLPAHGP